MVQVTTSGVSIVERKCEKKMKEKGRGKNSLRKRVEHFRFLPISFCVVAFCLFACICLYITCHIPNAFINIFLIMNVYCIMYSSYNISIVYNSNIYVCSYIFDICLFLNYIISNIYNRHVLRINNLFAANTCFGVFF